MTQRVPLHYRAPETMIHYNFKLFENIEVSLNDQEPVDEAHDINSQQFDAGQNANFENDASLGDNMFNRNMKSEH